MLDCEIELLLNYHQLQINAIDLDILDQLNTLRQSSDQSDLFQLVRLGASYLCAFVQSNFIGPSNAELVNVAYPKGVDNGTVSDGLALSGDPAYALSRSPIYLYMAKRIFIDWESDQWRNSMPSIAWWRCRTCWIWQHLFVDRRPELRDIQFNEFKFLDDRSASISLPTELKASYAMEKCNAYGFYYEPEKADAALKEALSASGLGNLQLTGVLGKRTKFQQRDIPQLTLDDSGIGDAKEDHPAAERMQFPLDCALNDDTLLDTTQFQSSTKRQHFTSVQECVILSVLENLRRTHAENDITVTEVEKAYLERLLHHPLTYVCKYMALFRRCRLEVNDSRRVERALGQAEQLVKDLGNSETAIDVRMRYFFNVNTPPIWDVRKLEARLLMSLGVTNEALRIYLDLNLWDDAVACYRRMGMLDRAEAVIREQLESKQTPHLWCLLGDVIDDESCYSKAWALSGNRLARSQSSLGMFYYCRKKFHEAVKAYETALAILPLDLKSWYCLGYCAMQIKDYQRSSQAYRRCSAIDPDNFEAWNNLAASYVHLGEKDRAFQSLTEALKFNYENWKVWENYVVVGVDTGHFREVVVGINRLIDLREQYQDVQVLEILVKAATDGLFEDSDAHQRFRKDLTTLFGRITSKVVNNSKIWRLYSELCQPTDDSTNLDEHEKHVSLLQKAHQAALRTPNWQKDDQEVERISEYAVRLAKSQLRLSELLGSESGRSKDLKASARLMLKGLIANLERSDKVRDNAITHFTEMLNIIGS